MHKLDAALWNNAMIGASGSPVERDFLRAIHNRWWLRSLRLEIQQHLRRYVAVTSIWVDSVPVAKFKVGSSTHRCELGDLALIVRVHDGGGTRRRMCILQGKVDKPNWQSGRSSRQQRKLYEFLPQFELFRSGRSAKASTRCLGVFDLAADLSSPPATKPPFVPAFPRLAFLLFDDHKAMPTPPRCATVAWPSCKPSLASFTEAVIDQAAAIVTPAATRLPGSPLGAEVMNGANPEWTRLFRTLFAQTYKKAASRLPGGAWMHLLRFGGFPPTLRRISNHLLPLSMITVGGGSSRMNNLYPPPLVASLTDAGVLDDRYWRQQVWSMAHGDIPPSFHEEEGPEDGIGGMPMLIVDVYREQAPPNGV